MLKIKGGAIIKLPKDKTFTTLFSWGISLFVVSAILVGFSWIFAEVLWEKGYHSAIKAQTVIDSKSSDGYKDFVDSRTADVPPLYEYWYFFNLTNHQQLIAGTQTKPHFEEIGPYIFTQIKVNMNISFQDDGNVIAYRQCQSWIWEPSLSAAHGCIKPDGTPCDAETDQILNINPGYMGAVAQAGSELALSIGFTGPALEKLFFFLQGEFLSDTVARFSVEALSSQKTLIMTNETLTQSEFLSVWANATSTQHLSPLWQGMLVSEGAPTPSNISTHSAQALFSPQQPYSLLNNAMHSYQLWSRTVALLDDPHANQPNLELLSDTFDMSIVQVNMVASWLRDAFHPTYTYPLLTVHFEVDSIYDLAYLQWGKGSVTPGLFTSIQQLYPEKNFPTKPEFALWTSLVSTMEWQDAKRLLNGTKGLFDAEHIPEFFATALQPNSSTTLYDVWGISSTGQLSSFTLYFTTFSQLYAVPDMEEVAKIGGGLFTSRTVNQWAWKAIDPLLLILQPESADVALQGNITDVQNCIETQAIDLFYTGKNDSALIGDTITYEGMYTWPPGWYDFTYHVHGTNAEGHFEPGLSPGTVLEVFDNNFMRTLRLDHFTNTTLKGVYVYRYTLSQSNFIVPQPAFYMKEGFQGVCNLTGPQMGAPIFISQSHFLGADPHWLESVSGIRQPDFKVDPTVVDVEPYSGSVVRTDQALQVNVYLPDSPNYFAGSPFGHDNLTTNVLYPVSVIRQFSELRDSDADEVKDTLYFGFKLQKILFGVFWGVGVFLLALSITLLYLARRRAIAVRKRKSSTSGFFDQQQPLLLDDDDEYNPDHDKQLQTAPFRGGQQALLTSSSSSSDDDQYSSVAGRHGGSGGSNVLYDF
mmetsp:Transcript_15409/g.23086  ORF Transcript_15409/g.23086 Transcript_15409/m.23086 type:complete len:867 (-) Transcript_15409:46-2646(-)